MKCTAKNPVTNDSRPKLEGVTGFINAGGRGTRLASIFEPGSKGVCKALLTFGDPPVTFVEHQVNKMLNAGISQVVVDVGDHYAAEAHLHSVYSCMSRVHTVSYSDPMESGGGLLRTVRERPELFEGQVLICCVDTLLDLDEAALVAHHREKNSELTVALTTLTGVPNEGAYHVDRDERIIHCGEVECSEDQLSLAVASSAYRASCTGAVLVETDYLRTVRWSLSDGPVSFYRSSKIMGRAIRSGNAFAFNNGSRLFLDVGTPERWGVLQREHVNWKSFIHQSISISTTVEGQ